MSDFVQPIVQVQADGRYRLVEEYRYASGIYTFNIPHGFTWDGASVPRVFWSISGIRPGGRYLAGSSIHDAFYRHGGQLPAPWILPLGRWTRLEADILFREMMQQAGIAWMQYHRAYWAVRMFSAFAWKTKPI